MLICPIRCTFLVSTMSWTNSLGFGDGLVCTEVLASHTPFLSRERLSQWNSGSTHKNPIEHKPSEWRHWSCLSHVPECTQPSKYVFILTRQVRSQRCLKRCRATYCTDFALVGVQSGCHGCLGVSPYLSIPLSRFSLYKVLSHGWRFSCYVSMLINWAQPSH